ncbi:hypothetical protein IX38_21195 [Chryseobacterium luteum]|uniref:Uncharacterized protein n=1 Tax=Chryseobacterium luteum TaxID=421531 RepID=A0A085YYB3_9FLAO|nr:hypothetical protein IX38_21195 [Chryseobacterium luteum]
MPRLSFYIKYQLSNYKQIEGSTLVILIAILKDWANNEDANIRRFAGKTNPQFIDEVCKRWKKESPTKETEYIIKKALRTIEKINL